MAETDGLQSDGSVADWEPPQLWVLELADAENGPNLLRAVDSGSTCS
jgi:hypothetical protein